MVVLEFTLRVSLRGWSALNTEAPAPETFPSDDVLILIISMLMFMLIQSSVAHSWISELRCSKFVFNKKDPSGFPPVEQLPLPVPVVPSLFCWKFERLLP